MLKQSIKKLMNHQSLTGEEMREAMEAMMSGRASEAQMASFLTALRLKGETPEEIAAAARVMREKCERLISDEDFLVDNCGTGGDGSHTFNISTAAAIVAAACGVRVAKHGNRAVSSRAGSADVLTALGVHINLNSHQAAACLKQAGICFMFAPNFHPAMKHVGKTRGELGIRTVFNILGPLSNPAWAHGQVLGVFDPALVPVMAEVLRMLGTQRAMVVHGDGGMDEITLSGETRVAFLHDGCVEECLLTAADFGLEASPASALTGGDAAENADIIRGIFRGDRGPRRDIVVANAAAAVYVAGLADTLAEGTRMAAAALDDGRAAAQLEALIRASAEAGVA